MARGKGDGLLDLEEIVGQLNLKKPPRTNDAVGGPSGGRPTTYTAGAPLLNRVELERLSERAATRLPQQSFVM